MILPRLSLLMVMLDLSTPPASPSSSIAAAKVIPFSRVTDGLKCTSELRRCPLPLMSMDLLTSATAVLVKTGMYLRLSRATGTKIVISSALVLVTYTGGIGQYLLVPILPRLPTGASSSSSGLITAEGPNKVTGSACIIRKIRYRQSWLRQLKTVLSRCSSNG